MKKRTIHKTEIDNSFKKDNKIPQETFKKLILSHTTC